MTRDPTTQTPPAAATACAVSAGRPSPPLRCPWASRRRCAGPRARVASARCSARVAGCAPRAAPVGRGTTGSTANTTRRRADRLPRRRPGRPAVLGSHGLPAQERAVQLDATETGAGTGAALAVADGARPAVDDGAGTTGAGRGAGTTGGASAARTTRRMNATSGSAGSNRPRSATGSGRSGSKATLRSTGRCSSASASSAGSSDCGMFVVIDAAAAAVTCRKWATTSARALLRDERADEAALAAHAVVVVGVAPRAGEPQRLVAVEVVDPGGHVAVGGDVAAAVGDAADRQRVGPDVDGHPAQRVDQRGQPVHVHHDVVGHREPEHRRDRRHQQVHAAIGGRSGGGQRGVRAAVLRDVVEQVVARRRRARVVEPVGEPGRRRRVRRERRVLDVAGECEQRRGRGPGVDAGDDHGVGPRARAVRTGVAAQQQDVHAGRQHRTGRHGRSGSRGGVGREHPVEQGALGVGEVRGGAERDGHADAERHGDRGAEHLVAGAAGAGVRRDEGPHDDRDPGDHDEDAEDRDREQDTRRHEAAQQAGAAEVGGGGGQRRRADQEDPHHPGAGAPTAEHDVPEAGDRRGGRDGAEGAADPDGRGRRADPDQERRPTRATRPMLGGPTATFDSNERGWPRRTRP